MVEDVTRIATNPAIDLATVKEQVELVKKMLHEHCLEVLTAEQRQKLDELLGKPFDLTLLTNAAGTRPRPLTFVFGLTWQNPYYLLADPDTIKQLGITPAQIEKITALLNQENERLTAVRLGALKKLNSEFSRLSNEDKYRVVRTILDGARDVFRDTNAQALSVLSQQQAEALHRRLVRFIGARAIGADKVAEVLELTPTQKQAFAKANLEFEQKTAPLRVVFQQSDFDSRAFEEQLAAFEATARSLLTPAQVKKLESFGQP
jgi:uncharacterized protein (DUF2384 family)